MKNREEFLNAPVALGTWLSSGSSVVSEVAAQFSFDWFLLDLEHGSGSEAQLLDTLRAMSGSPARLIVRVPDLLPDMIGRVLDRGADGIMLPHVTCAQQAEDCVKAMRYLPYGTRGFSSSVRAYNYGLQVPQDPSAVKPVCMAQIEDAEGVRNAKEIAAVEGVDILFVGPADLKLALSHQSADDEPLSYEGALRRVSESAKQSGKKAGILMRNIDDFDHLKKLDYSCIAVDSDLGILKRGYREVLDQLKK